LDGSKDAIEQISADRNFSKLEADGAGMSDDPCANFNQPRLQTGQ
jgi:hypothetical protein